MKAATLIAGGLIGAAAIMGAAGEATAHADDATDAFLSDMESAGLYNQGGDATEIALGVHVCFELSTGAQPMAVAHELYQGSQLSEYGSGSSSASPFAICARSTCVRASPTLSTRSASPASPEPTRAHPRGAGVFGDGFKQAITPTDGDRRKLNGLVALADVIL